MSNRAIVVGAGIVGLAVARVLRLRGFQVTILEKSEKAVGASIRNFGMIWPIGQPEGELYQMAIRSRDVWQEIADSTDLWHKATGSLHVAYFEDEWLVLQELFEIFSKQGRKVTLLNKDTIAKKFPAVNQLNLLGGLFSAEELIVNPRTAIPNIATYLQEFFNVNIVWNKAVTAIQQSKVFAGKEVFEADLVFICNGADFETLYPETFAAADITKCKLQMMRFRGDANNFDLGTSICGGLSLTHYHSFKEATTLPTLQKRYATEMSEYISNGIHVMVSQNQYGELTVGDSHEYGLTHEPFDSAAINELITTYLGQFTHSKNWKLLQTWNGIYPKMQNGDPYFFETVEPNIYILNGLGGAGMTMSFGVAEKCVNAIIS